MMVTHINGTVSFSCPICTGRVYPCLSCSMERSVYDLGFKDGNLGNPYEATGFNQNQQYLYDTGYKKGKSLKEIRKNA